ncbi:putative receptor protein kinase [Arachis hypogaea]|nr:putative receptor protein kinase [Arachis hypogaea]
MMVIYLMINSDHRKRCFSLLQKMTWKKTSTFPDHNVEDFIKSYRSMTLKRYSYGELKGITNSFNEKLRQEREEYGIVYKARLVDDRHVIVKVLKELKGREEKL